MPPDFSVASRQAKASDFVSSSSSPFERRIIENLCEPLLRHIPDKVHPNTISLITHLIAWLTSGLALWSVELPPAQRLLALCGAGFGMFAAMVGDCLDGMHARRTGQCSQLGEMMDHWLDAIIVPLAVIGITYALEMAPWALVTVNIAAAMIYQAQLVLYHHTGKFIHPEPTNGVEAQFGTAVGYVAAGVLFYCVDRHTAWLDLAFTGLALTGLFVQMRCNLFYYVRLGRLVGHHLVFVALCSGFGVLYLLGAMDAYAFALTLVFTSFRISGSYVLFTIVGKRYGGNDYGIVLWLCAIAACYFVFPEAMLGPVRLLAILPYAACAYLIFRNFVDFARHYDRLRA